MTALFFYTQSRVSSISSYRYGRILQKRGWRYTMIAPRKARFLKKRAVGTAFVGRAGF